MKRTVFLIIVLTLIFLVIGLIVKNTFFKPANAALKIDSIPSANIFLDGKPLGKTPYEEKNLPPGEKNLKLVPEGGSFYPWETKIKLTSKTETVVKREFRESEAKSSGEIISLEKGIDKKTASLSIVSIPDSVRVSLNGEDKGFTPLVLEKLSQDEVSILFSSPGFREKTIRTKLFPGFRTNILVKLAEEEEKTEEKGEEESTAEPKATSTPSPKSVSPTVTPPPRPYIEIKNTPTGWLRVRLEPSTSASEAAKVYPGEKYPLLEEKLGWYKIEYKKGEEGWVAGQYCEKYE